MGANARESNRRIGERMVADEVAWLGAEGARAARAAPAGAAEPAAADFAEVEALWQEVVAPALPGFRTMQPLWDERSAPPAEESVWRANWPIEGPDQSRGPRGRGERIRGLVDEIG